MHVEWDWMVMKAEGRIFTKTNGFSIGKKISCQGYFACIINSISAMKNDKVINAVVALQ